MSELVVTLRALHQMTLGKSVEPDPDNPGRMRLTAFCAFCASHRPDEDPRWPCETARLLMIIETGQPPERNPHLLSSYLAMNADGFGKGGAMTGSDRHWALHELSAGLGFEDCPVDHSEDDFENWRRGGGEGDPVA